MFYNILYLFREKKKKDGKKTVSPPSCAAGAHHVFGTHHPANPNITFRTVEHIVQKEGGCKKSPEKKRDYVQKNEDIVFFLRYNFCMTIKTEPQWYCTPYQVKLPVEIEIIEISDSVYTFSEVMEHIDLNEYLVQEESETGRPRYDPYTLLKMILFAFMENGYVSTRQIEKYCKTDIRYMWLLQDRKAPSHMTVDNFMNHNLKENIAGIFAAINGYIYSTASQ